MQTKPEFNKAQDALDWCRSKYQEREKDLCGSVPHLEMFLMGLVEVFGSIAVSLEAIATKTEFYNLLAKK